MDIYWLPHLTFSNSHISHPLAKSAQFLPGDTVKEHKI